MISNLNYKFEDRSLYLGIDQTPTRLIAEETPTVEPTEIGDNLTSAHSAVKLHKIISEIHYEMLLLLLKLKFHNFINANLIFLKTCVIL